MARSGNRPHHCFSYSMVTVFQSGVCVLEYIRRSGLRTCMAQAGQCTNAIRPSRAQRWTVRRAPQNTVCFGRTSGFNLHLRRQSKPPHRAAYSFGDGGSLARTRLCAKFPAYREKYREFPRFRTPFSRHTPRKRPPSTDLQPQRHPHSEIRTGNLISLIRE